MAEAARTRPVAPRAQFGKLPSRRAPYKGVVTESVYVPMRDGVGIAVDVMRPAGIPDDAKLPTVLIVARYWRSMSLRGITPKSQAPIGPRDRRLPKLLLAHGYALVVMDTRGSGASGGSTSHPFSETEIRDCGQVVDWIIAQPWSDGAVGSIGISYEGIAAELLTVAHPAVRAVIPQEADIDQYADWLLPGGVHNLQCIDDWQRSNEALDAGRVPFGRLAAIGIKGVRPVDADTDSSMLRAAIAGHAANADIAAAARAVTFRDDPFGPDGVTVDDISAISFRERIEAAGVPIFSWGSWLDGSTADGVIRRFATYSNPQRAVIGAWSHRFLNHASPYCKPRSKVRPSAAELWQEALEYFDHHLKGTRDGAAGRQLYYYTLGEEAWKVTGTWPPPGTAVQRWYLGAGHTLSQARGDAGADTYAVDFEATTGTRNRWHTQDGVTKEVYRDRARDDERLLTYTSDPLPGDMEVTGYPIVSVFLTSTHDDGAFHVYLEDVGPDGKVTYVTEGRLRAIHRRISDAEPAMKLFVPHHSYLRSDAMPLVPGEVAELRFGLLPVSVLFREGHRIRVAIAGHDADTFARIPAEGHPLIGVQRGGAHASHIDLPVVEVG